MSIEDILMLLGGLALFLYGMNMMSNGLETTAGNKMKGILEKLTSNRFKGVLAGALITAAVQSSSATTVMTVGFVNAGLMTLTQAAWVIMGANIGTTITGQLIALDMGAVAPLIAFVAIAMITFVKNDKTRHIASIFAGLGILFMGMSMMSDAMKPLRDSEVFMNFMTTFSNPVVGILVGALVTAVIQSSSASVGILQALASTGMIPLSSAVFVLFGMNIGTCITAVLASIGTKPNARRTTLIHLMFNIFGSVLFTIICLVTPFTEWMVSLTPDNPISQIANVHTVFNIVTTVVLLPFGGLMVALTKKILPETQQEEDSIRRLKYINPMETHYVVGQSALALTQIGQELTRMLEMVKENLNKSFAAVILGTCPVDVAEDIEDREEYIDYLNVEISKYITKMMVSEMSERDSEIINKYYTISSNLERIGDHARNIEGYAKNLDKWGRKFSDFAVGEIVEMQQACDDALDHILAGIRCELPGNETLLGKVAKDEQRIDDMEERYREFQTKRLQAGECEAESSLIFSELLTDFERIGDHALNIAEQYQAIL